MRSGVGRVLSGRLRTRMVFLLALVLVALTAVVAFWTGRERFSGDDARLYLDAANASLAGGSIYDSKNPDGLFGFIYPPFAVLPFMPLTLLPAAQAIALWQTLNLMLLLPLVAILLRASGISLRSAPWWPVVALALVVWYPVTRDLLTGQIDLVLITLVAVDFFLLRKTRWHGLLIGLAAGIKLTPAVYVITLALGRDWHALRRVVLAGLATVLIGFAFLPADSIRFWTNLWGETGRSGAQAQALSQSWASFVARITDPGSASVTWPWVALWVGLVLLTIGVGCWVIRDLLVEDLLIVSVGANALIGLLVSPLSTMHHWVAALPLIIALGVTACRARSGVILGWLILGLLLSGVPSWWVLGSSSTWGPVESLLGSSLVFWAAATLPLLRRWRHTFAWTLSADPSVVSERPRGSRV